MELISRTVTEQCAVEKFAGRREFANLNILGSDIHVTAPNLTQVNYDLDYKFSQTLSIEVASAHI